MAATQNALAILPVHVNYGPRNPPAYVSARVLAASVAESITIPAKAQSVRLAATADTYYSFTTAATVPVDTDDGTSFELLKQQGNAEWLTIPPGASAISVISAGTPVVTASFYTA
jgi:hypothetical protein